MDAVIAAVMGLAEQGSDDPNLAVRPWPPV